MSNKVIVGSELESLLPQRFPFLFVDRIYEYEVNRRAAGIKNVAVRERLLVEEDSQYWPDAYVVESLGQLSIALFNLAQGDKRPNKILLGAVSGVTFHAPILMGCSIDLKIVVRNHFDDSFVISGYAEVAGERKLSMDSLVAKIVKDMED
jgi:3-hydroxyacyl-[acyl-carrier-protein] dehydratase